MVNLMQNNPKRKLHSKLIKIYQYHKGAFSVNLRYGWSNNKIKIILLILLCIK